MEKRIGEVTIECVQGNIADQPGFDAVVNAANAQLRTGGGVAGVIHGAAGPELEKACRPLAPIRPGQAVITAGFGLPNPHVIHCLGPVYGRDRPEDRLLADCYRNALHVAGENRLGSIAFPAISTGAFGYPLEDAAGVAIGTVLDEAAQLQHVRRIRFVLYSEPDLEVHEATLGRLAAS